MPAATKAVHSIGVVSRRTGLKPDLIRAWERRYRAVEPARTEGRHRLYSDADVERLLLLRDAVAAGRNIGTLTGRTDEELAGLIADDRAVAAAPWRSDPGPRPRPGGDGSGENAEKVLEACLDAVQRLDAEELAHHLERGGVALSRATLLLEVVVPLMWRIGDLWHQGALRPIHEHLASATVRSFVGGLRAAPASRRDAPRLVVTTPTGQLHELGALLVATCAAEEGWEVTYLGADLPAAEIAAAAERTGARAVVLSITYPPDDPTLAREIESLGRLLPAGCRLLVGGTAAAAYEGPLRAIGARQVDDVPTLRRELTRLRSSPRPGG
jgi:MerR family transcriptional regulator, light-induced transcriptional regulator